MNRELPKLAVNWPETDSECSAVASDLPSVIRGEFANPAPSEASLSDVDVDEEYDDAERLPRKRRRVWRPKAPVDRHFHVLDVDMRRPLRKILSHTDPFTFGNAMLTCKALHKAAISGEVHVKYHARVVVSSTEDQVATHFHPSYKDVAKPGFMALEQLKTAAREKRVQLMVDSVEMPEESYTKKVEHKMKELESARSFLKFMEVKTVGKINPESFPWFRDLQKFVEEFQVREISGVWHVNPLHLCKDVFRKLNKIDIEISEFWLHNDPFACDFLVHGSARIVNCCLQSYSKRTGVGIETFQDLIQAWTLGRKTISSIEFEVKFEKGDFESAFASMTDAKVVTRGGPRVRPLHHLDWQSIHWLLNQENDALRCEFVDLPKSLKKKDGSSFVKLVGVPCSQHPVIFKAVQLGDLLLA